MSKQIHSAFRKVLLVESFETMHNGQSFKAKRVLWCIPDDITSRSVKTRHIGYSIYISNGRTSGVSAWMPRKAVSINLVNPLKSRFFAGVNFNYVDRNTGSDAYRQFVLADDSRCKSLQGLVKWWSVDTGVITIQGQDYEVHACNIAGAKTWYPETACMYLKQGETITVDLKDMGDYLTCRVTSGGHFDADKWNSLDQSKLAFRCNEAGEAVTGLFV